MVLHIKSQVSHIIIVMMNCTANSTIWLVESYLITHNITLDSIRSVQHNGIGMNCSNKEQLDTLSSQGHTYHSDIYLMLLLMRSITISLVSSYQHKNIRMNWSHVAKLDTVSLQGYKYYIDIALMSLLMRSVTVP